MGLDRYLKTYIAVRDLPLVVDPKKFAKEFDLNNGQPVHLDVYSRGLGLGGGRTIKSTIFPYQELETIRISSIEDSKNIYGSCQERYINVDHSWGVFWIEIGICGNNSAKFFGPYRMRRYL